MQYWKKAVQKRVVDKQAQLEVKNIPIHITNSKALDVGMMLSKIQKMEALVAGLEKERVPELRKKFKALEKKCELLE